MTAAAHPVQPRTDWVIERENTLEIAIQGCLDGMGISLLCEWDVFALVYRHGVSLVNTDRLACPIGYEITIVSGAPDRGIWCVPLEQSLVPALPLQSYSSLLSRAPTRFSFPPRMNADAAAQDRE